MTVWAGVGGLFLLVAGLAALRALHRAAGARRADRLAYFDDCQRLLSDVRIGRSADGFARLNGSVGGLLIDLQVLPDLLNFRKLPSLWLMVTLPVPQPVRGTTDFMMRPTGSEIFSRFGTLPIALSTPAAFPADLAVRTDDPAAAPGETVLDAVRAAFFSPKVKEVLISPRGLRIVWLAEEADRSRYLIFRDAELGRQPLSPRVLQPLLDHLLAIADAIAAAPEKEKAA